MEIPYDGLSNGYQRTNERTNERVATTIHMRWTASSDHESTLDVRYLCAYLRPHQEVVSDAE